MNTQGRLRLLTGGLVAALFACALGIRVAWLLVYPFDGLYGQDAFAYFQYAPRLAQAVSQLRLPPPFEWPLGYPALVALSFGVGGQSPLAAQTVSLLCGALVTPVIYLWIRETSAQLWQAPAPDQNVTGRGGVTLGGEQTLPLLVAALLAAVSGQLVQSSIVVMADAPATLWATLSALALARYTSPQRRDLRVRWLMCASLALAGALCTRWVFAALVPVWALAFVAAHRPARDTRRMTKHALAALLLPLPLLAAQWGALVPSTSLNHAWLSAWSPLNAFSRVFDNADGHFVYDLPVAVFYAQPAAHPYYIFPLFLPWLIGGAWVARRLPPAHRFIIFGWLASVYLLLAGIPYENFRFGLALWSPLVVLTGVGLAAFWGQGAGQTPGDMARRSLRLRLGRAALLGVVTVSLCGMLFWNARGLAPLFAMKSEHLAIVRLSDELLPPDGTLIALGMAGYFRQYAPDVHVVELYNQTPETLQRFVCSATPVFLLVEPEAIATQWAERQPALNVGYLREQVGLREVARLGAFTLSRVGGACA